MDLTAFFKDKTVKPSAKTGLLAEALRTGMVSPQSLLDFSRTAKDAVLGTCIEAMEYRTKNEPAAISSEMLDFVISCLGNKAPRVRWESARVVGNVIQSFPEKIADATANLLPNTAHDGTVVRWSAAYALGKILEAKQPVNESLLPAIENVMAQEEKNSIKKIYAAAIKKARAK